MKLLSNIIIFTFTAVAGLIGMGTLQQVQAQGSAFLYTCAAGRLYIRTEVGPSSGNAWFDIGPLPGPVVTAMTFHIDRLYAVSNGNLFKQSNDQPTPWMDLGTITAGTSSSSSQVTAITSHWRNNQQQLVIAKGDHIYVLENGEWIDIGIALGITGLVSSRFVRTAGMLPDTLYVTTVLNQICKRYGDEVGNNWDCYEDSAYGIKGATILDGELFVAGSDDKIFKRGEIGIGPGSGNDWQLQGIVYNPTALAASVYCPVDFYVNAVNGQCMPCPAGQSSDGGTVWSCRASINSVDIAEEIQTPVSSSSSSSFNHNISISVIVGSSIAGVLALVMLATAIFYLMHRHGYRHAAHGRAHTLERIKRGNGQLQVQPQPQLLETSVAVSALQEIHMHNPISVV